MILNVSASPHIRCKDSTARIMWSVVAALLPAAVFGVYIFGVSAAFTIGLCIASAVLSEYIIQRWQGKCITIKDGSAVITGLLLAMNVPANLPWYMCVSGSVVAIAIAKHTMGGLGYNIFNPALIGRSFLLVSWPLAMTTWPAATGSLMNKSVDALTAATPLGLMKWPGIKGLLDIYGSRPELYKALFFGIHGGSLGETSAVLIILGGLFLIYRGYIKWQMPLTMIVTVAMLTWIFGGRGFFNGEPIVNILTGGLLLGAFFMATDMVTIPITIRGQVIFACGAGCIIALIRLKGGYPEGVCYGILIMNALTPLIDRLVSPRKFGARR